MSDLVGTGKALEPFSQGAVGLVRRIFGPASSELGEILRDRVRSYRADNIKQIVEGAARKVGDDEDVLELPLRFALPFIDAAAQEDDELMQDMWSALLSDASKGVSDAHYIVMESIKGLTPASAQILFELSRKRGDIEVFAEWEYSGWLQEKFSSLFSEKTDLYVLGDAEASANGRPDDEGGITNLFKEFERDNCIKLRKIEYTSSVVNANNKQFMRFEASEEFDSFSTRILERLNLVNSFRLEFKRDSFDFCCFGVFLNDLGLEVAAHGAQKEGVKK